MRYSMMTKVMQMERFVVQSLLYDFYGELLTPPQQEIIRMSTSGVFMRKWYSMIFPPVKSRRMPVSAGRVFMT